MRAPAGRRVVGVRRPAAAVGSRVAARSAGPSGDPGRAGGRAQGTIAAARRGGTSVPTGARTTTGRPVLAAARGRATDGVVTEAVPVRLRGAGHRRARSVAAGPVLATGRGSARVSPPVHRGGRSRVSGARRRPAPGRTGAGTRADAASGRPTGPPAEVRAPGARPTSVPHVASGPSTVDRRAAVPGPSGRRTHGAVDVPPATGGETRVAATDVRPRAAGRPGLPTAPAAVHPDRALPAAGGIAGAVLPRPGQPVPGGRATVRTAGAETSGRGRVRRQAVETTRADGPAPGTGRHAPRVGGLTA